MRIDSESSKSPVEDALKPDWGYLEPDVPSSLFRYAWHNRVLQVS